MICILALSQVSRFQLVSVAEQAGLNLTWSKMPEDMFLRDVAHNEQCHGKTCLWRSGEPHHAKTCLRDFRPGKIQTSLLSYRS